MSVEYTAEEFKKFDRLTWLASSQNQMARIEARLALNRMRDELGKEKLDTMWEVIKDRDRKRRSN